MQLIEKHILDFEDYMTVNLVKTPLILISSGEDYVFRNPPKKRWLNESS